MNPRDRLKLLGAGLAGLGAMSSVRAADAPAAAPAGAPQGAWKVVMQVSESLDQAEESLVNMRNVLELDPNIKFVVVAYSRAIRFLVNDTLAPSGALFSGMVGGLANMGVEFKACNNTLHDMKISPDHLLLEASVVPAGVLEIIRLQAAGWFYVKP